MPLLSQWLISWTTMMVAHREVVWGLHPQPSRGSVKLQQETRLQPYCCAAWKSTMQFRCSDLAAFHFLIHPNPHRRRHHAFNNAPVRVAKFCLPHASEILRIGISWPAARHDHAQAFHPLPLHLLQYLPQVRLHCWPSLVVCLLRKHFAADRHSQA